MKQFFIVVSLFIVGIVAAACEPTSSPTAASAVNVPAPVTVAPTPPPSRSQPVLKPDYSLSGVVSEMTSDGLVPLAGVEIYCDACGEFGHTRVTTDENGAYDFGRDGIWSDDGDVIAILINKDGYKVSGGSQGPSGSPTRYVKINGDTRFDFQMVRRE
jgi:hypothetical protein